MVQNLKARTLFCSNGFAHPFPFLMMASSKFKAFCVDLEKAQWMMLLFGGPPHRHVFVAFDRNRAQIADNP
jgi:hypothetical protein